MDDVIYNTTDSVIGNKDIIGEDQSGQRFDKYLIRRFPEGGKGFVYKMLRKKRVKLNGKKAEGCEMLAEGDVVTFYISPETQKALKRPERAQETARFGILYEDENVLLADKPAGVLTHPDLVDAVAAWAAAQCPAPDFRPVAVNRLDRNTSGIVIVAKTLKAAQGLSLAIRLRTVERRYLAAVAGRVDAVVTVSGGHVKDRSANKVSVADGGKDTVTVIRPLEAKGEVTVAKATLVEAFLVTGRSHQIRAHLQSIGRPIIGDPKYGDPAVNRAFGAKRQMLHAWKVRFGGLTGKMSYLNGREFVCEPKDGLLRGSAADHV